ncbi:MAG: tRNA uridine-5-carboxymethylaminomethyl(34) synthesis GTPase MnmE [Spirochaetales bacterium]|nr:tRNA uridine-5-carboxymethylaminomethyl(34) synthesis GTPase MnmE [Spirochaetales bacterium]
MKEQEYEVSVPIAALATPWAESAIAMIRISGDDVVRLVSKIFSSPQRLIEAEGNSAIYGKILSCDDKAAEIDEVLLFVFRSPNSFTGEESVEISCHGSLPGIKLILDALFAVGIRAALPGEFTFRAFMNGKVDLTEAEAICDLVKSKTVKSHSLALHRLGGAVFKIIDDIKNKILDIVSLVELQLDYPGDEIEDDTELDLGSFSQIIDNIEALADTYATGRIFQDGIRVALCGQTNSGKSSIFNMFLKEDRSIVSDIHGTTRDYLESMISLRGIPITLFDTAGIRVSADPIEMEGIRRAQEVIDGSDIIVYVVDSVKGVELQDDDFMKQFEDRKILRVWNKADLSSDKLPDGFVSFSAVTGLGFADLENSIVKLASVSELTGNEALIDSARQKSLLDSAAVSMKLAVDAVKSGESTDVVALYLKESLDSLGEITGEVTSADILHNIFGKFCLGK